MSKIVDEMLKNGASKKPVAQFHMVGDKVLWQGIKLTVVSINEETGHIVAWSPTMHVVVDTPEQLKKLVL